LLSDVGGGRGAMKKTKNTYEVYAIVEMNVSVKIDADSFQDALVKAKELRETDFVKPLGAYIDGEFEVHGIFDSQVQMEHRR